MEGHKIHGLLPSGQSCAGERYKPEIPELEAAVLPTPEQRSGDSWVINDVFTE